MINNSTNVWLVLQAGGYLFITLFCDGILMVARLGETGGGASAGTHVSGTVHTEGAVIGALDSAQRFLFQQADT